MIIIKFEENQSVAYDENKKIGECDFIEENNTWNIIHTEVDNTYQGQGIAKKQSRTASARRRGHPLQISARRTMPPSARLHKSLTGCLQGLAPPCHEQYNKGKM